MEIPDPEDMSEEAKRAWRRDYQRELFEGQMEVYRVAFKNTGNPVYVWKALRWLHPLFTQNRILAGEDLPPGPGVPPEWCMEYLLKCARAVDDLCWGLDPRDTNIELSEGQRIDVLPAVLGFTRPGWNAFSHYYSIKEMEYVGRYLQELRDEGVPYSVALVKTAERYGYQDERSLRRRMAKSRAVFSDPPEEDRTQEDPEQGQT
jgi:hypothetical protein